MPEKLVKEWIAKAEEDYKTALTLNSQRKHKLPKLYMFSLSAVHRKISESVSRI